MHCDKDKIQNQSQSQISGEYRKFGWTGGERFLSLKILLLIENKVLLSIIIIEIVISSQDCAHCVIIGELTVKKEKTEMKIK